MHLPNFEQDILYKKKVILHGWINIIFAKRPSLAHGLNKYVK